jgi:hypothetical protein
MNFGFASLVLKLPRASSSGATVPSKHDVRIMPTLQHNPWIEV